MLYCMLYVVGYYIVCSCIWLYVFSSYKNGYANCWEAELSISQYINTTGQMSFYMTELTTLHSPTTLTPGSYR